MRERVRERGIERGRDRQTDRQTDRLEECCELLEMEEATKYVSLISYTSCGI